MLSNVESSRQPLKTNAAQEGWKLGHCLAASGGDVPNAGLWSWDAFIGDDGDDPG